MTQHPVFRIGTRLVDIRPGESALVLKIALVLFCTIAGHTVVETARDALFLAELEPKNLTLVYVALAGLVVVAARLGTSMVTRFGTRSALIFTLVVSAYGTTAFYLLPRGQVAVFSLYLWSGLVGSVAVVQFWLLAGHVFTVAQGKRLFGPLSAGGVLGAVSGASAAIGLLRYLPTETLLMFAVAFFLAGAFILTTLNVEESSQPLRQFRQHPFKESIQLFRRHRYLRLIAVLLAIATAALLCTDYLFKSTAARFIEPSHLGTFFATYYAALNAVALLFQFVVSGYVLKRLGILASFTVLPLLLLAGGASVMLLGGLFAVVLATKAADGSLRHSLHRVASELLWMPLPENVRTGSKSFVDTVVVRFTQAAVGGGIFFLAAKGWDGPRVLGALVVGLATLWVCLTLWIRTPYLSLFKSALQSGRRRNDALDLDLGAIEVVVEALSSRVAARAIAAIELLSSNGRARLVPALIFYHESEEVLLAALREIPTTLRKDWQPQAERLLTHESGTVRVAAMRALADFGRENLLETGLSDTNPEVRGHAAFLVAEHSDGPRATHSAVQEVLNSGSLQAKIGLVRSVENRGDSSWAEVLLELAKDSEPELVQALAKAARAAPDRRLLPFLIPRLATRDSRDAVRDALVALGEPALHELERLLSDPQTSLRLRSHLPRSISRFESQAAADILVRQLSGEQSGLVRYKILRGLSRLASHSVFSPDRAVLDRQLNLDLTEHLRLHSYRYYIDVNTEDSPSEVTNSRGLLSEFLNDKVDQSWERVLRLLQIMHPNDDLHSVGRAAKSHDKRTRAQALEYVDALTLQSPMPENRLLLILIMDDLSPDERINRFRRHVEALPLQLEQTLAALISDNDETLATLASFHALALNLRPLQAYVAEAAQRHPVLTTIHERLELAEHYPQEPVLAL